MGIGNANYVYWEEAANVGAPFILTPPVISGLISVGSVLTSTQGTVSAAGTTAYAYQWMKNSVAIASANANTYTLVTGDIGGIITCVVSATNADGKINMTSNTLGPVTA